MKQLKIKRSQFKKLIQNMVKEQKLLDKLKNKGKQVGNKVKKVIGKIEDKAKTVGPAFGRMAMARECNDMKQAHEPNLPPTKDKTFVDSNRKNYGKVKQVLDQLMKDGLIKGYQTEQGRRKFTINKLDADRVKQALGKINTTFVDKRSRQNREFGPKQ